MKLFTLGYRSLNMPKIVAHLRSENVGVLVDVRINNEHMVAQGFACGDFLEALPRDIVYEHVAEAGNPYRPPQFMQSFDKLMGMYSRRLLQNGGHRIVAEIAWRTSVEGKNACLMCACRDASKCHRSALARLVQAELRDYFIDPVEIIDLPRPKPVQASLFGG